jgi:hypothetical protein
MYLVNIGDTEGKNTESEKRTEKKGRKKIENITIK